MIALAAATATVFGEISTAGIVALAIFAIPVAFLLVFLAEVVYFRCIECRRASREHHNASSPSSSTGSSPLLSRTRRTSKPTGRCQRLIAATRAASTLRRTLSDTRLKHDYHTALDLLEAGDLRAVLYMPSSPDVPMPPPLSPPPPAWTRTTSFHNEAASASAPASPSLCGYDYDACPPYDFNEKALLFGDVQEIEYSSPIAADALAVLSPPPPALVRAQSVALPAPFRQPSSPILPQVDAPECRSPASTTTTPPRRPLGLGFTFA